MRGNPPNAVASKNFACAVEPWPLDDFEHHQDNCRELAVEKYGNPMSAYMRARLRSDYYSPEDQYEALLKHIITSDTTWLDIGCGRSPFPNNCQLASELSKRCKTLVGIDPDPAIRENRFLHERHQLSLEQYTPTATFDLVTARMVVEHVTRPEEFVATLSQVTKPGSLVVILTVNWWSITALAAHASPMWLHHLVKRGLWNTDSKDTFPTEYNMNQRVTLSALMQRMSFDECFFKTLPDASLFWRMPVLRYIELAVYKGTRRLGLPYLDTCILAAYRRSQET